MRNIIGLDSCGWLIHVINHNTWWFELLWEYIFFRNTFHTGHIDMVSFQHVSPCVTMYIARALLYEKYNWINVADLFKLFANVSYITLYCLANKTFVTHAAFIWSLSRKPCHTGGIGMASPQCVSSYDI